MLKGYAFFIFLDERSTLDARSGYSIMINSEGERKCMSEAREKIVFADSLRGVAVLSVLIFHYFYFFYAFSEAINPGIGWPTLKCALPYDVHFLDFSPYLNLGIYGVSLFFLISGFVIPFSLCNHGVKSFLIQRFFRLVPPYIIALLLVLIAYRLSTYTFDIPFAYTWWKILVNMIPGIIDLLKVPTINGVTWTLEIEMKFYCVCALAFVWFRTYDWRVFLIPIGMFCLIFLGLLHRKIARLFPVNFVPMLIYIFIGVALHFIYQKKLDEKKGLAVVCALFTLSALSMAFVNLELTYSSLWSMLWALVTFMVGFVKPHLFSNKGILGFFARMSYSIYLIHGTLGYTAMRVMLFWGIAPWAVPFVATALAIGVSWIFFYAVEEPSRLFGKRWIGLRLQRAATSG